MRLLIDCTGIQFSAPTNGYSRVVRAYLLHAQAWSQQSGVPVWPIRFTQQGQAYRVSLRPGSVHAEWTQAPPWQRAGMAVTWCVRRGARRLARVLSAWAEPLALPTDHSLIKRCVWWPYRLCDRLWTAWPGVAVNVGPDDVVFMPSHWDILGEGVLSQIRLQAGVMAVMVHDVLPVTLPQRYPGWHSARFGQRLRHLLALQPAWLAASRFTQRELRDVGAHMGVHVEVALAHHGVNPLACGAQAWQGRHVWSHPVLERLMTAKEAALLMVGTLDPKKGYLDVIRAMHVLWRQGDARSLVVVGKACLLSGDIVHAMVHSPEWGRRLHWLADVDDADLDEAYRCAQALVFGSEAEGFGLPLIEAARWGCPVLARDTLVTREVMGDAAHYVDGSEAAWVQGLQALAQPSFQRQARASLEGWSWPQWQHTVPTVFNALLAMWRTGQTLHGDVVAGGAQAVAAARA